jgi:hypothetical protein
MILFSAYISVGNLNQNRQFYLPMFWRNLKYHNIGPKKPPNAAPLLTVE